MRAFLLFLFCASIGRAGERPAAPPALRFVSPRPAPASKSLLERVFSRIDGGDMNGWAHPDGTRRKPENALRTLTLQLKLSF